LAEIQSPEIPDVKLKGPKEVLDKIIEALKEVYDPEIPVNVWDLGLIYEINVEQLDDGKYKVKVVMTLTAIGCPVSFTLPAYIEEAIRDAVTDVVDVYVEVVYDPPWTPLRITKEGREILKAMYGYDIVEQWAKTQAQGGM